MLKLLFNQKEMGSIIRCVLFVVVACLTLAVGITAHTNTFDYPYALISGERVLMGQHPFTDFMMAHGPGAPYIHAAVMGLLPFVSHALAVNLFYSLVAIFYFGLIVWHAEQLWRRRPFVAGLVIGYVVILMPLVVRWGFYSLMMVAVMGFSMVAMEEIFSAEASMRRRWTFFAIFVVSAVLAVAVRLNFGLYMIFGWGCAGLWRAWLHPDERRLLAWQTGLLVVVLTVAVAVYWWSGQGSAYWTALRELMPHYGNSFIPARHLLQYSYTAMRFVGFLIAAILLVPVAVRLLWTRNGVAGLYDWVIIASLAHYASTRLDWAHEYPFLLLAPLLWMQLEKQEWVEASSNERKQRRRGWALSAGLVLLGVALIGAAKPYWGDSRDALQDAACFWNDWRLHRSRDLVRHHVRITREEAEMLDDLAHRNGGRAASVIWVPSPGNCETYSQIGANLMLYVAAGQVPQVRIWYSDMAVWPYGGEQAVLIQEVEARRIPWVGFQGVLNKAPGVIPANSWGSRIFYDYVRKHYDFEKRYLDPEENLYFDIYRRRDGF